MPSTLRPRDSCLDPSLFMCIGEKKTHIGFVIRKQETRLAESRKMLLWMRDFGGDQPGRNVESTDDVGLESSRATLKARDIPEPSGASAGVRLGPFVRPPSHPSLASGCQGRSPARRKCCLRRSARRPGLARRRRLREGGGPERRCS